jgi:hypothetical protein
MSTALPRIGPWPVLILGLIAGLSAAGCQTADGDISGRVSYQGKSLDHGSVTFVGADGIIRQGHIEPDGNYTIRRVAMGPAKVAVVCYDPRMTQERSKKLRPEGKASEGGKRVPPPRGSLPAVSSEKLSLIPTFYADIDRSGLTFHVMKGRNTYHIELK